MDNEIKEETNSDYNDGNNTPAYDVGGDNFETGNNWFSSLLYDMFEVIIVSVAIVFAIFALVGRTAQVKGNSMRNTLENGDRLLVREILYTPKQGDIIVCQSKYQNREALVKRVIATAGQTVRIDSANWEVYVDGVKLNEYDYVRYVKGRDMGLWVDGDELVVPEGKVFVMGDNRSDSLDSRSSDIGLIDEDWIMGKVFFRIAPFAKFGTV